MGFWAALRTGHTAPKISSSSVPTQTAYCRKLLVSIFIVWNAAAILFTNTGAAWIPWSAQRIFVPYARLTRVMQRWSLFCPEPRRYVSSYYFMITYGDGTRVRWQRPAPPLWDYFERMHAYNWQKYDTASNHLEDSRLWPDLAQWATGEFSRGPAEKPDVPVEIRLFRHFAVTPPPNTRGFVQHAPGDFSFSDQAVFDYFPRKEEFL